MATPTFKRITLAQFRELLDRFRFTRQINAVHMHHTWRPSRADFRGHDTIVSMWRFHTQENHWRDIAQHITIDPAGDIWLGRDWNLPPASAGGHNGNSAFGPFMFEMVGNFDRGCDPFDGAQKDTALGVVAAVQKRFGLEPRTLVFHNAMSGKTCPGNAIDYEATVAEVERLHAAPAKRAARRAPDKDLPFPDEPDMALEEALRAIARDTPPINEPADAELSHHEHDDAAAAFAPAPAGAAADGAMRAAGSGAAALAALRPHLVNLTMGRLSAEGELATSAADVDALFDQHLEAALAQAQADGQPLRLLFYAHGGLVSESSGLQIAAKHIAWWRQNGIYPIYFIWETGFFETIGQLLQRARPAAAPAARDLADYTTDPVIEITARALQGPRIWGGMKSSAEHAADAPSDSLPTGGGAHYVATRLKAFCDRHAKEVELHAVGHSAGSIFHAHFVPLARELGAPAFKSLSLMAPAIRVDTFKQRLLGHIGAGKAAERLHLFTMLKDFERADDCAKVYRKSLLYLIHNALEDRRGTPILGLEESLRGDPALRRLFGLDGQPGDGGEVVWSVSASDTGRHASRSTTHGGFDDDAATLNSIVRRVLGKEDADPVADYGRGRDLAVRARPWTAEVDLPAGWGAPAMAPAMAPAAPAGPERPPAAWPAAPAPQMPAAPAQGGAGQRRALCIGIDRYPNPAHQLAGCVADARLWARTLEGLGFEATLLTDQLATRAAIDTELRALVSRSRPGDVIVLQYAGHGTTVTDLDGDEDDGHDEALCPVDFEAGALYIDDDIAEVLAGVPHGVNLTVFMDCCHSGTNTRFAVGAPAAGAAPGLDERRRFVVATPEIEAAHARFRQALPAAPATRAGGGSGGTSAMRNVKFAACLDSEVAWESQGQGEFTLRATRVLAGGAAGLTNQQFVDRVVAGFGANPRQHPMLDCAPDAAPRPLLQPLAAAAAGPGRHAPAGPGAGAFAEALGGPAGGDATRAVVQALVAVNQALAALALR